jgi:hypothetical protein
MRRPIAVLVLVQGALLTPVGLFGHDHLAPHDAVAARLSSSAAQRQHDLAVVKGILARPAADPVVSALGQRVEQVQAAASSLGDRELRDLAGRAEALGLDPTAGHMSDGDVHDLIVVLLVVAIVVVILDAAD